MNFTRKLLNLIHFHRKQTLVGMGFCGGYGLLCYKGLYIENEVLRMGIAGSLANIICESAFHAVDTVNIRAKASTKQLSTLSMVNKIWAKEGVYGFSKGFTACFYGASVCGFMYFSFYKAFKGLFKDRLGDNVDVAFCFLLASFFAEIITLSVQYPYDLIKCRLQSVNYLFKYQNIPHAVRTEIKTNGIGALYEGALPFLTTYTAFVAL